MITEELMQPGRWDLVLSKDTPMSVRSKIVERGHIIITETDLGSYGLTDQDYKDASIYSGRVDRVGELGTPGEMAMPIGGTHVGVWLGDADNRGVIFTTTKSFSAASWSSFISSIRPASIAAGTVTNNPSSVTGDFFALTAKAALDHQGPISGGEWRVTNAAKLDSGVQSDLFVVTPKVLVARGPSNLQLGDVMSRQSPNLGVSLDASKWLAEVHLAGKVEAAAGSEDIIMASADLTDISKSNPYKDFLGNADATAALINDPVTFLTQAQGAAEAALLQFYDIDELVTLDLSKFYVSGDFQVGDTIHVYHPPRILDQTNQVPWGGGGWAFPKAIRVYAMTWPVRRGMGVYYRDKDGVYTNLSLYVGETGEAIIDVGVRKTSPIGTAQGIAITALNAHNQPPNVTKEPYAVHVRLSGPLTITTATNTQIEFDSQVRDTYNMWKGATTPDQIDIPVDGWYTIHAGWDWSGSSTSGRRTRCWVYAGGSIVVEQDINDSLNNRVCNASVCVYLSQGDIVTSNVWHNIGSDGTLDNLTTFLSVAKVPA